MIQKYLKTVTTLIALYDLFLKLIGQIYIDEFCDLSLGQKSIRITQISLIKYFFF